MDEKLVGIFVGIVLIVGFLALLVWLSPGDGSDQTGYGNWYKIANPRCETLQQSAWVAWEDR